MRCELRYGSVLWIRYYFFRIQEAIYYGSGFGSYLDIFVAIEKIANLPNSQVVNHYLPNYYKIFKFSSLIFLTLIPK
jgi:hypothetical protein